MSWRRKQHVEAPLQMSERRVFQMLGTATAKLREPKHVRTLQTNNVLESDEHRGRVRVET